MIGFMMNDLKCSVDLFQNDQSGQIVGESHFRDLQPIIGSLTDFLADPQRTADHKGNVGRTVGVDVLDQFGETDGINFPALQIQQDDIGVIPKLLKDPLTFDLKDVAAVIGFISHFNDIAPGVAGAPLEVFIYQIL